MNDPADGFEQRQAFYDEAAERDEAAFALEEKLADESRDVLGYHVNEYGEIIAHAVTTYPRDSSAITVEIAKAILL